MTVTSKQTIEDLIADLENIQINLNHYWEDSDPQRFYDTMLSGKLDVLSLFCKKYGWNELAIQIDEMLPLERTAPESMERIHGYVIPEIRILMEASDLVEIVDPMEVYWDLVHPRIKSLCRQRFESGFFGDAVETAFKEVNSVVKQLFLASEGRELDGAGLMTSAFSPSNPVIKLSEMISDSDKSMQQGYMQIFAGSMTGIRNPKAHGNLNPEPTKALHLICLASLLLIQVDERV